MASSIVVPSVAGPFNLGTDITARSKIEVDQTTAQVIATDSERADDRRWHPDAA